jgi:hypothetical protein
VEIPPRAVAAPVPGDVRPSSTAHRRLQGRPAGLPKAAAASRRAIPGMPVATRRVRLSSSRLRVVFRGSQAATAPATEPSRSLRVSGRRVWRATGGGADALRAAADAYGKAGGA